MLAGEVGQEAQARFGGLDPRAQARGQRRARLLHLHLAVDLARLGDAARAPEDLLPCQVRGLGARGALEHARDVGQRALGPAAREGRVEGAEDRLLVEGLRERHRRHQLGRGGAPPFGLERGGGEAPPAGDHARRPEPARP